MRWAQRLTGDNWTVTCREVSARPGVLCKRRGSRASPGQYQDVPALGPLGEGPGGDLYLGENAGNRFLGKVGRTPRVLSESLAWLVPVPAGWVG